MYPNGIRPNDEGVEPAPESAAEFPPLPGGRPENVPIAALVFKEMIDGANRVPDNPTQGIKWWQNDRMYGYWEHDWDLKRLAFRWWWAQVMIDSLWARGLNYVLNKLRRWKR